jgi:YHS domain-containing protein
MKPLTILSAAILLAAPTFAQNEHDHGATGHDQQPAAEKHEMTLPTKLVEQTLCPITGEELEDHDNFIDYEGQRIYVCCKKCKTKVAVKPEQIAMAMFADGVQLENLQTIDPVSGKPLKEKTHFHQLYNKRIYVNDMKDVAKVAADPAKYLDVLEGRKPQERCAVMGGKIDPEASFEIEGMHVGQCCGGCEKKWKKDPAAKFAVLVERKEVVEPVNMTCPVMPKMNGSKKYPVTLGAKRYYLCGEKVAMMFVANPEKYLPGWYAAQGIKVPVTPAAL